MADITSFRQALVTRIVDGDGHSSRDERRAAFLDVGASPAARALVARVALEASRVTDDDIASARAAGLSEDEIFELAVCAAVGQATRQIDRARAALAAAAGK